MNTKDKWLNLKRKITDKAKKAAAVCEKKAITDYAAIIDLNDKVDAFIDWYTKNMINGHYTRIGEYQQPAKMRNLIEKIAVWYELRYPDYDINKLISGSEQEPTEINNIMFEDNNYINALLDENSEIRKLDWHEFYNSDSFIKSLPWDEKYLLKNPKYSSIVYFNSKFDPHLHLKENGTVEMAENVGIWTNSVITDEELKGLHATEIVQLFKERNIKLPSNNELEMAIESENKWNSLKEKMLNCVMYRIIERGGNRVGPRRAFLFAREFNRNIDIPMMYGVDYSDPELRLFINEYIKAGGSKELVCYNGYFARTKKNDSLDTISIQDLILTQSNNALSFYTPEEDALHQRLVNSLTEQQKTLQKRRIEKPRL